MSKSQVNFRLEKSLIQALRDKAEEKNIGLTELVTHLLEKGLESNIDIYSIKNEIDFKQLEDTLYQRITNQLDNFKEEMEESIYNRISKEINSNNKGKVEINIPIKAPTETKEECIDTTYTEDIQIAQKVPKQLLEDFFNETSNEKIMIPGKLTAMLNENTNEKDWDIQKLKSLRLRQLTWVKNQYKSNKKEPQLPLVVDNKYIIDWVISKDDSPTATGKYWWVCDAPKEKEEQIKIIEERRKKYISENKPGNIQLP